MALQTLSVEVQKLMAVSTPSTIQVLKDPTKPMMSSSFSSTSYGLVEEIEDLNSSIITILNSDDIDKANISSLYQAGVERESFRGRERIADSASSSYLYQSLISHDIQYELMNVTESIQEITTRNKISHEEEKKREAKEKQQQQQRQQGSGSPFPQERKDGTDFVASYHDDGGDDNKKLRFNTEFNRNDTSFSSSNDEKPIRRRTTATPTKDTHHSQNSHRKSVGSVENLYDSSSSIPSATFFSSSSTSSFSPSKRNKDNNSSSNFPPPPPPSSAAAVASSTTTSSVSVSQSMNEEIKAIHSTLMNLTNHYLKIENKLSSIYENKIFLKFSELENRISSIEETLQTMILK
jgi:hypothetical protein